MTEPEGHSATARNVADVHAIVVKLDVDSDGLLFILLSADRSINRVGSGTLGNKNRDMFIGMTPDAAIFERVRSHLTQDMLECQGETLQHQTARLGAECKLDVVFQFKDGTSGGFTFLYGAASAGPPSHVVDLVRAAVRETESWYQGQLKMVEKNGP